MEKADAKSIIEQVGNSIFYENSEKKRIIDFVNENEKANNQVLKEMNSYEKFLRFVSCLPIRKQSGTYKEKGEKYYKSDELEERLLKLDINDNSWKDTEYLDKIVKESRIVYPFNESVGEILSEAKKIYDDYYSQNFSKYLDEADYFYQNFVKDSSSSYFNGPFLKIKGVGYKTRDLGLSTLINSFLSVDRHLMRIPYILGIFELSDIPEEAWDNNTPRNKKEYNQIARFLMNLSYQLGITPKKFDRIIWKFATEVCTKTNPICGNCMVEVCKKRQ